MVSDTDTAICASSSSSSLRISPTGFSISLLTYDSKHSTHVKCASAHEMPSAAGASQKHIVHVCEGRGGGAEVSAWTRRRRPGEARASARSGAEVPNAFRRETEGCLQSRPPRGETRAGRDTRARWRLARVGSRTFSSDAAMPGASPAPRALACGALRRRRRGGPKAQQRFARRTSSANAGFKRDGRRVDLRQRGSGARVLFGKKHFNVKKNYRYLRELSPEYPPRPPRGFAHARRRVSLSGVFFRTRQTLGHGRLVRERALERRARRA